MLHIRPITEKDASPAIAKVYEDIKKTLHIHFVPLLFQYIAGFEEYFLYAWEKQKQNIQSEYYQKTAAEIIGNSEKSVASIYHMSKDMQVFLSHIQTGEKQHILQTSQELEVLNANLLILTIGLREGVKGVVVGQQILPKSATEYEETVFDQFINQKIMHANLKNEEKDIIPAERMLAPLFGNSEIIVNQYPAFFATVAHEMEELVKTEKFLNERVLMEQHVLTKALQLPYPLGCSYSEIAGFAGKKPYFSELLYILAETFPTKFPRLVFTSALMKLAVSHSAPGKSLQV